MKVITIGRNKENNDVVVNDERVSRNHLQLIMDDNGNVSVMDLNSTNGTFVNGQRISKEIPLDVTDEVKIGNTVLPWQSYFENQLFQMRKSSVPSREPIPQQSNLSKQQMPNPVSKSWLKYVIVGTVILLLVVGGIVWKSHQPKPTPTETLVVGEDNNDKSNEIDLVKAQAAADKAEKEFANAQKEAAEAKADAEEAKRKAAESNSEKDKQIAREKEQIANEKAKKANKAEQDAKKLKAEVNTLNKEIEKLNTELSNERTAKNNAEKAKNNAEKAKKSAEESLTRTKDMQKILNGWDEAKARKYCKYRSFPCRKDENPKNVIAEMFAGENLDGQTEMINEMKTFKK